MSEQRIDEKRLVEIEEWAELVKDERRGSAAVALDLDLVADLRAARTKIERLRSHATALMMELGVAAERDEQAWKAEIERLKGEADRRVAEEREACAEACVEVMKETDGAESRGAWVAALRIRARGSK